MVYEMSKIPFTLRDDRLHASICTMECSFTGLKPKNKPKPVISLSEGLRTKDSDKIMTFHSRE